jgi:predicted transcriptional regulator
VTEINCGLRSAGRGRLAHPQCTARVPRGDRNKLRSTLCRKRAFRATRQTWTRVDVTVTEINCGLRSAGNGRLAHPQCTARVPRGDRNKLRSTLRRKRAFRATRQTWTRVDVTVTEINCGLRFAGNGRFAHPQCTARVPRGDRNKLRSTLRRTRASRTPAMHSAIPTR